MRSPGATLPKPTVHDPATYWMAYHMNGDGRTRAKGGYVCYAVKPPSNRANYYPGWGKTERDALLNACYWTNQGPCIRVVPLAKAPVWAIERAHSTRKEE